MTSLGADMVSGRLVSWHVKPGDEVHRGDIVATVDTSKAEIDIEIFQDGVIEQVLVDAGYAGDATEAVIGQIERFAPGFRERIVATGVISATEMARRNPNFVGGDILTGAKSPLQFLLGPRLSPFPYDTGVPGSYLCSAATPPGPGIHGISGANAARRALRQVGAR